MMNDFDQSIGRNIILGLIASVVALGLIGLLIWVVNPFPSRDIKISTGPEATLYYQYAQKYAEAFAKQEINLEIVVGNGSTQTIERLLNDEVDFGFVQGGTLKDVDLSKLVSIGSLYYEPIWLFYRDGVEIQQLNDLKGKRVAAGIEGTGIRLIAEQVLGLNNVTPDTATFVDSSVPDAAEALKHGEVDAAFFVMSPTSSVAYDLLTADGIQLLNIDRAEAYSRKLNFLNKVVLSEGILNFETNVPDLDYELIATTTVLMAHQNTLEEHIFLVLPHLIAFHNMRGVFEADGEFPSGLYVEAKLHPTAERYYANGATFVTRFLPPVWAAIADRLIILLIPIITLMVPIVQTVPSIYYRFGIRYKIVNWYSQLHQLDTDTSLLSDEELKQRIEQIAQLEYQARFTRSVPKDYLDELYDTIGDIVATREYLEQKYAERNN